MLSTSLLPEMHLMDFIYQAGYERINVSVRVFTWNLVFVKIL